MARLLLDEQLPRRLTSVLEAHSASTVRDMGWSGLRNGILLRRAESDFDVFVTMDRSIPFQQSLGGLQIGVLLIRARNNSFQELGPYRKEISSAASTVMPGTVAELDLRSLA
jgi:predicted nuclease of predicted toxin-antitoxin system